MTDVTIRDDQNRPVLTTSEAVYTSAAQANGTVFLVSPFTIDAGLAYTDPVKTVPIIAPQGGVNYTLFGEEYDAIAMGVIGMHPGGEKTVSLETNVSEERNYTAEEFDEARRRLRQCLGRRPDGPLVRREPGGALRQHHDPDLRTPDDRGREQDRRLAHALVQPCHGRPGHRPGPVVVIFFPIPETDRSGYLPGLRSGRRSIMKTIIVYHSFSGVTRAIAERVGAACNGDLVEVRPREPYSKLTAYSLGSFRARGGKADPVAPSPIDVSAYDLIVLGTPVWAWRPTPVTNGAVEALVGTAGKNAVLFATCGSKPGDTLQQTQGRAHCQGRPRDRRVRVHDAGPPGPPFRRGADRPRHGGGRRADRRRGLTEPFSSRRGPGRSGRSGRRSRRAGRYSSGWPASAPVCSTSGTTQSWARSPATAAKRVLYATSFGSFPEAIRRRRTSGAPAIESTIGTGGASPVKRPVAA